MEPDRRDPLHPPESPTPPRDRGEAERRIAQANQDITRLRAEIAAYKYRFDDRDSYTRLRRNAIFGWEREKGICRDFLKARPASAPAPAPAPAPPPPVPLPLPVLSDLLRIEAFLDDGIRAAGNEKRRRVSMPVEVAVEHLAVLRRYTRTLTDGNVLPLRQRSG